MKIMSFLNPKINHIEIEIWKLITKQTGDGQYAFASTRYMRWCTHNPFLAVNNRVQSRKDFWKARTDCYSVLEDICPGYLK